MHVSVDGVRLFYRDGWTENRAAEPVVLIPGLGTTHLFFNGLAELLGDRYRLIGLDLRGVGQSDRVRQTYSMEGWADDIAAVLDHIGLGSAHILGSSLGGCVAQVFAQRYPAKVRSLILSATFSEIDPMLELNYRVRIALIRQTGMSQLLADLAVTSLFGRTFYASPQGTAVAANTLNMIRANDIDIYIEHLTAVLRFGQCEPGQDRAAVFTRHLPAIKVPTLVLCGDEDVLTVPKFSRIMAAHLPQARLVVQEGCGHLNIVEKPAECAQLIDAFLRDPAAAVRVV